MNQFTKDVLKVDSQKRDETEEYDYYVCKKDFTVVWNFYSKKEYAENALEKLKKERLDRDWEDYVIMREDDFLEGEKKKYTYQKIEEITAEKWNDQLNVLPPILWETNNSVNSFCMCEMWTGSYTHQYAKFKNNKGQTKYYCTMVDIHDRDTWIYNRLKEINYGE
jgi:hypothetical protein